MPKALSTYGFSCPQCGEGPCTALSARPVTEGKRNVATRRRRKCEKCDHRFTTIEVMAARDPLSPNGSGMAAESELEARRLRLALLKAQEKIVNLEANLDIARQLAKD